MVKSLRKKFVLVTTSLLFTLFGGFLIINTIFTNYWSEIEIADMLDWIAYTGIFLPNTDTDYNDAELIRDITGDESQIIGVIVDNNGNIISSRVIGQDNNVNIPHSVINKMQTYEKEKIKVGNYYYSYNRVDKDTVLLVIMDSSTNSLSKSRLFGIGMILVVGIILLEVIIFWLSRFVTKPAEESILREKQFISDASHELKTPLGAISINAQALELENAENIHIKNILSESGRMGRLIEKLLILSKLDEQENVNFTNINLSSICEEMSLTYESVAFEKNVDFIFEIEPDISILGNADEIRQLLAILIDNAIKNSDDNGSVSLKCQHIRKHREIIITNTGKGIDKENLHRIFERFYTSDNSRSSGSFGLGLAIAKTIVERHKGTIMAESEPNNITTFKVIL